ncbi:hypothetical protein CPB84DRAFT_1744474 [Gymnopilus junonius]|uniref:Uncharacterized protein n=1 Tax=Gymnopilus junonius TaxID=109634 RepID=A0A9P5NSV9_GYMJU|nr:hypothetical protein CPB84DRAFT_1744474 [Gymnopilus junonius]
MPTSSAASSTRSPPKHSHMISTAHIQYQPSIKEEQNEDTPKMVDDLPSSQKASVMRYHLRCSAEGIWKPVSFSKVETEVEDDQWLNTRAKWKHYIRIRDGVIVNDMTIALTKLRSPETSMTTGSSSSTSLIHHLFLQLDECICLGHSGHKGEGHGRSRGEKQNGNGEGQEGRPECRMQGKTRVDEWGILSVGDEVKERGKEENKLASDPDTGIDINEIEECLRTFLSNLRILEDSLAELDEPSHIMVQHNTWQLSPVMDVKENKESGRKKRQGITDWSTTQFAVEILMHAPKLIFLQLQTLTYILAMLYKL